MSRSRSRSLVLSSALVLAACSEGGIDASRHAECRADPERALVVQAFAPCPGRGTPDAPFCRMASALALIKSDTCPAPWVIDAQGTFPETLEFNNAIRDTGPSAEPPPVNVTIKGGTFGGDPWTIPHSLVQVGSNVTLTLDTVRLTNSAEQGIDCGWSVTRPPSSLRLRKVTIDSVRNAVVTNRGCSLDAEGLTVDAAYGGGLQVGGEYRIRDSEIKYSAAYGALLEFDNGAKGLVDGLRFRNNITRFSLINCSQLPRELRRLDIIHRGRLFADPLTCKTVDSTLETLP